MAGHWESIVGWWMACRKRKLVIVATLATNRWIANGWLGWYLYVYCCSSSVKKKPKWKDLSGSVPEKRQFIELRATLATCKDNHRFRCLIWLECNGTSPFLQAVDQHPASSFHLSAVLFFPMLHGLEVTRAKSHCPTYSIHRSQHDRLGELGGNIIPVGHPVTTSCKRIIANQSNSSTP